MQKISHIYLKLFSWAYKKRSSEPKKNIKGLEVKNRLGLAAGLDKNGELIEEMSNLGFGFIEIGTVTPKKQLGNKKPRIFRIEKEDSLLNSLGFNNKGAAFVKKKLQALKKKDIAIGANIGPNKNTESNKRKEDYSYCFKELADFVDYIVLNISSPNTPDLRDLHNIENLKEIIECILKEKENKNYLGKIFLKLSPDEKKSKTEAVINLVNSMDIDGVIASNTSDDNQLKSILGVSQKPGGISGKPLKNKSNELLKLVKSKIDPKKIIVAVGGVFDVDSYNEKIELGADLVQLYTGLIYEGPNIVKRILNNGK